MDSRGNRHSGVDGYSDSDGLHETSFNTASDGGASDPNPDEERSDEPIKSSRYMPVPEHMKGRYSAGGRGSPERGSGTNDEVPPPSYDEAVSQQQYISPGSRSEADDGDDPLTPEEIAVIMRSREDISNTGLQDNKPDEGSTGDLYRQRQKARNDYLPPGDRRDSYEEAMEMLPASERDTAPREHPERTIVAEEASQSFVAPMEMEEGRRQREEFTCEGWGVLDKPVTRVCRFLRRQSLPRLILFSLLVMAGIGLLLFVGLFPASFVYVDYHKIALKQSKMTGVVERDTVYYPGCYVLGPDTKFLYFTGSVHNIIDEMSVFTVDTIAVTIRFSVHYFIRPPEVGKLFSLFYYDYDEVFQRIIRSSMRNLAGSLLTVDNFRFNRTFVETQMHAMLRKRLGGDCCPACCKDKMCQSNAYCSTCRTGDCYQGYHVDVRYFHLLSVSIPSEVFERLLYRTILEVRKEKEFFLQDHAVMVEETKQKTQLIRNEAKEIRQAGQFEANKIAAISEADMEKVVQNSYAKALQGLYSRLNVTQENHKLSLLMIRALEDSAENLYKGFGFEKNTLFSP